MYFTFSGCTWNVGTFERLYSASRGFCAAAEVCVFAYPVYTNIRALIARKPVPRGPLVRIVQRIARKKRININKEDGYLRGLLWDPHKDGEKAMKCQVEGRLCVGALYLVNSTG